MDRLHPNGAISSVLLIVSESKSYMLNTYEDALNDS